MSKNVEFILNTMEEPNRIARTNLYYFQVQTSVVKNGRDRHIDYLIKQLKKAHGQSIDETTMKDTISIAREYAWVIYSKPKNITYEDFVSQIKEGKEDNLHRIGDLLFSPINQNLQLDKNRNLLLKTSGADMGDN